MTAGPESDAELLERWRAGDKDAGDVILTRHANPVIRFFRNKVPNEADDLVQRTFLRLVEGRDRIRDGTVLRAYILGIARYVLGEWIRQNSADKVDLDVESIASYAPGPSSIIVRRREHRLLVEALRHLPIEHQIALELYYWEGLSANEISAVFGVSHSAMRSRLARARTLLIERITELGESAELIASTVSGLDGWADEIRRQLGLPPDDADD